MKYYSATKKGQTTDTYMMNENMLSVQKRTHIVWFYLFEILEQAKVIYGGKSQDSVSM